MTDLLLDYDPNDSGEIPRPVGETRIRIDTGEATRDLAAERDRLIGEDTVNIGPYAEFSRPIRRPDHDDTILMKIVEPPLGLAPWGRVIDIEDTVVHGFDATVDGDLRPAAPGPRPGPLPPNPPPAPRPGYVGRHRDPLDRVAVLGEGAWGRLVEAAKPAGEPRRWRVFTGVSAFVVLAAAVTVVVLAVAW